MTPTLRLIPVLFGVALVAAPVHAQTATERVVEQLRQQGFSQFEIRRTMLGRTKIEARRGDMEREIVVSQSGRVLKDEIEREGDRDGERSGRGVNGYTGSGDDRDGDRYDDSDDDRGSAARERDEDAAEEAREADKDRREDAREAEKDRREDAREAEKDRDERDDDDPDDDRDDDDDDDDDDRS